MNIAVFASGFGSNFQAIADAIKKGKIKKAKLKLLVTDRENSFARVRAKKMGIKDVFIDPGLFKKREEHEREIAKILKREEIELIVLAGYMRVLTGYLVKKYRNRILNIHPALLPAFKGVSGIEDAFKYGVKVTGVTVHFVDERVDHGPIILQEPVKIRDKDSLKSLEERIHKVEHTLYPEAIKLFVEGRLKIKGRKVEILTRK